MLDGEPVFFEHPAAFRAWPRSKWSAVNVALVAELEAAGLMTEAGRRAFAARDASVAPYSVGDRPAALPPAWDARLRADHPEAAAFWDAAPASYRKLVAFWLADAKRAATQEKRFAELVEHAARGERLPRFER